MSRIRRAVLGVAVVLSLVACDEAGAQPSRARCDLCGMRVDPASGWRAGALSERGAALAFDSPKCMFRYRLRNPGVREPWVIEYYAQERRPAAELFYVLGTDLASPMGRDLVPVADRAAAERLLRDHQGERVLAFAEVTSEIVEELFRPRSR